MTFSTKQFCTEPSYRGLHVQSDKGPLIAPYLDAQLRLYEFLLPHWTVLFGFRFDLHFPSDSYDWDSSVISAFTASLDSKVKHFARQQALQGRDVKPRLIWAKEQRFSLNNHYHVAVLMDGNLINASGSLFADDWSLRKAVIDAWASALGLPVSSAGPLVQFVDNGDYLVDIDSSEFLQAFTDLFYRTSYFAKADTKHYGTGTRNHSCSCAPVGSSEFDLDDYVRFHKVNLWDLDEHQFLYTRYAA